ncbi:hypothetical protein FXO37_10098 [Capsicum annuum]|nr:hypothetical protein FXO37_10098 [Capsicum annuum]
MRLFEVKREWPLGKMREARLRWFGHVMRRCVDAPVRRLCTTSLPSWYAFFTIVFFFVLGFVTLERRVFRKLLYLHEVVVRFACTQPSLDPWMEKTDAYRKGSGSSKKWDGGGPGSGPYGGGPRGPPRGLDNVRGIDHSSLPACGSCCG